MQKEWWYDVVANAHLLCNISINFNFWPFQGEIGRRSGGDNVLEREGYAVSAGFALGLVALGMVLYLSGVWIW